MTRVEVQVLHEDRLNDLLCLLDLEKELSVTIHVVKDLSTEVLCQVVEQL